MMLARDKPKTFNGDLGALPAALLPLTKLPRWIVWRWVKKAKWTKPPYRSNDPRRNAANSGYKDAVTQEDKDGIGFNLFDGDIGAVDLDDCRDPETEVIADWAQAIIDRAPADAYVEVTVSGTGLRIIGTTRHREKKFHRKFFVEDGSYEVYGAVARYITISGFALEGRGDAALPNIDKLLEELIKEGDKKEKAVPPKGEKKEPKTGERKAPSGTTLSLLTHPDTGPKGKVGVFDDRSAAIFGFIKKALNEWVEGGLWTAPRFDLTGSVVR
jgi:hypothetical protein